MGFSFDTTQSRLAGTASSVSPMQPVNAYASIDSTESGIFKVERLVQSANALDCMATTEAGMDKVASLTQPEKA